MQPIQAINDNYNSYTPVDGYGELKSAIITKFKRDNELTYDPSQIVVIYWSEAIPCKHSVSILGSLVMKSFYLVHTG